MPKCDQGEKQKKIVVDQCFFLTDEQIENVRFDMEKCGTSIILYFAKGINIHQAHGSGGTEIRNMIKRQILQRVMDIFKTASSKRIAAPEISYEVEISLMNFNNGEIRVQLLGLHLNEDSALILLKKLIYSLGIKPIRIKVGEQFQTILFNGWGFRYV